jgi:phage-related protein (TIGR01555 family)
MTLLDRITGLFSRNDAPPAAAETTALVLRQDASPVVVRQDSTINPWTGFGDPTRDKGSVARPNIRDPGLTQDELLALWDKGGLARRMIELLPDRAIRKGWSVPDIPTEEEERLHLYDRFAEAWKMGDLWGGALLLMVTEDDVPMQFRGYGQEWRWLQEPLNPQRVGQLNALQVYDAREAMPFLYDGDIRSPNYRQPLLWQITDRGVGGIGRSILVHHSRVLWFRGAKRPPSQVGMARWGGGTMPDDSILQALWAEIRRLTETLQGGAILAMEIRQKVLKVSGLEKKMTGDQSELFKARMSLTQKLMGLLGVLVIGDGDEYDSRSNATTGWKDLSEGAWDALAAARGWPKVVLRGDAPSGLNTDGASAWQSFHQTVSDAQERRRSLLNRLYTVIYSAQDGPTRGRVPKKWAITFHPLDEPSQKDMADVRERMARVDQIYVGMGAYTVREVVERRLGRDGFTLDMQNLPIPDPDAQAERAIEQAERMRLALEGGGADRGRGGADPEDDEPETRGDAAGDGTVVVVPAADPPPELVRQVEQAIGQRLRRPTNPSHVTVLYLGEGLEGIDVDEVVGVVQAEAFDTHAHSLRQPVLRAFPPGEDGVPVIVEFEDAWALSSLNERLLRRLAHVVRAKQFRRYRAHLTLGYAAEPLTAQALTALAELKVEDLAVSVVVLEVRSADQVVATVQVGG